MLETDNDILKHEHGEKFMRFLFVILIWVFSLPKNHYLHIAHLIAIEINMIITKVMTVWKNFVNNLKNMQQKITNCEKLKMLSLPDKGSKLHKKNYYVCRKKN